MRSDDPIKSCKEDKFGREIFAEKIADTIVNYNRESGFVIGIYAAWGTGKTSLLNMIKEKLSKNDKEPIIFNFDPWYFSRQDQLLEQFFYNLASTIEGPSRRKKRIQIYILISLVITLIVTLCFNTDFVVNLNSFYRWALKIVSPSIITAIAAFGFESALKYITIIGKLSVVLKNIGNIIGKKSPDKVRELNVINSKKVISKLIKELKRKIVIFIDDIDRLTKEEIYQIFQLVKGLADFPNTIYVLSFDPKIIGYALSDIQGENKLYYSGNLLNGKVEVQRSNDNKNAQKFLEKIIQYPFFLPEIQRESFIKYLSSNIDKIVGDFKKQHFKQYYWDRIAGSGFFLYFSNIREVNRFLNVFSFDFIELSGEVSIADLVVISAIKSKDNNLYGFIKNNKEIFCGSDDAFSEIKSKNIKRLKSLIDSYNEEKNNFLDISTIEPILEVLFPFFSEILRLGNSQDMFNNYRLDEKEKEECRVADFDIFERFFKLSVPDDQVSNSTIASIIALQNDKDALLSAIEKEIEKNKGSQLIQKLRKKMR